MPNVNFTIPSAVAVGDRMEAHICYLTTNVDVTQSTPPAGWTFLRTIQVNNNVTDDMYIKTAVLADRNATANFVVASAVTAAAGVLMSISNSTGEDDYKAFALSANPLAATPGALGATPTNVTQAGELVLIMMLVSGNVTLTPPAGWTVIRQLATTHVSLLFAHHNAASSGAVAGFTISLPSPMDSFCAEISYLGATSSLNTFTVA